MSSGGDSIRMCGFSAFFKCGMQYFDTMKVPRVLISIIRSNRFMSVPCELVRLIALALLTQMSRPPNSATVFSIAAITWASSRISHTTGSALPPAARTSSGARIGCAKQAVRRHEDGIGRGIAHRLRDAMTPRAQARERLLGKPGFDLHLIRHPLVVQAGCCDGGRDIHTIIEHVDDYLQYGR